jgi:hypothetical protein
MLEDQDRIGHVRPGVEVGITAHEDDNVRRDAHAAGGVVVKDEIFGLQVDRHLILEQSWPHHGSISRRAIGEPQGTETLRGGLQRSARKAQDWDSISGRDRVTGVTIVHAKIYEAGDETDEANAVPDDPHLDKGFGIAPLEVRSLKSNTIIERYEDLGVVLDDQLRRVDRF